MCRSRAIEVRHGLALPAAAVLLGAAAPNPAAFQRKCEVKIPVATCYCMVGKLRQSRDGQIAIDAFRVMEMPEDQRQASVVELANKYETNLSGVKLAIDNAKAQFDTALKACL
jgi:hypothetical protein